MELSLCQLKGLSHTELLGHFLKIKEEFEEHKATSSELEELMEEELNDLKAKLSKAEAKVQQLLINSSREKDRLEEIAKVEANLRRENSRLSEVIETQKKTIVRLEIANDKLENSDRMHQHTIENLTTQIDALLEKTAFLEVELDEQKEREEEIIRMNEMKTSKPQQIVVPLRVDELHRELDHCQERMEVMTVEDTDVEMQECTSSVALPPLRKSASEPLSDKSGVLTHVNSIVAPLLLKMESVERVLVQLRERKVGF